ncbi:MAG: hypothetical protein AB1666_14725 [Pseudomonadota bacterium]|uniref:DUF883 domain-containing protein n=1 Tax=Caldimonas aquatica TaxID=376175 RepID=A0ABY6MRS0_9BURK|nr:hypothetical protein [Schlegelella aquatica]UZD54678.1 hypothetical protein OMP39_13595 [Schlegelella aquatica]
MSYDADTPRRRYFSDDSVSALQREWADLRKDVNEVLSKPEVAKLPEVRALKDRLQEALRSASDTVADVSHGIGKQVRYTASAVDEYVRDRPWKFAVGAAAVGLVVGLLLGRRR